MILWKSLFIKAGSHFNERYLLVRRTIFQSASFLQHRGFRWRYTLLLRTCGHCFSSHFSVSFFSPVFALDRHLSERFRLLCFLFFQGRLSSYFIPSLLLRRRALFPKSVTSLIFRRILREVFIKRVQMLLLSSSESYRSLKIRDILDIAIQYFLLSFLLKWWVLFRRLMSRTSTHWCKRRSLTCTYSKCRWRYSRPLL